MTDIAPSEERRARRWRVARVRLSPANYDRLCGAARKRDVLPQTLLDHIVQTVLDADLIKAVLDDER